MADERNSPENRKRAASEDEEEPRFKRRYDDSGYQYEVRLLVQSQEAGTIIGRGGDNIKRLRQDYNANIQVSDNRGPERTATFGGGSAVLTDLIENVLHLFLEKQQHSTRGRRDDVELRMLIHQSQAGCVIGKAGSKLREMRQDFGVEVKVFAACCPMSTDRIVRVSGSPQKVTKCIVSIVEMLRTWPPKGFNNPYDPMNFDPEISREYGGYTDDGGYGGGGGGGGGGGRFGDRDRRGGGGGDYGPGPSRSMMPDRGMGPGMSTGYPVGPMRGGMGGPPPANVTTQQVSIPADLAGIIIGKGGQKIKQVRADSGAEIELSDAAGGASDRIITITGTLQQIQAAQYMLQMAVKQYLERP